GFAVALDPGPSFVGGAAGGHVLDVGVGDRFDEPFEAAFAVGLLEARDVVRVDVRLADSHPRPGVEADLDRVELGRDLPADRVEGGGVVVFDRGVDELGHQEGRPVAAGRLDRLFEDTDSVGGVLRRAGRVQHNPVANLTGQAQAGPTGGCDVERNGRPDGLPGQADVLELNHLAVVRDLLAAQQQAHRLDVLAQRLRWIERIVRVY